MRIFLCLLCILWVKHYRYFEGKKLFWNWMLWMSSGWFNTYLTGNKAPTWKHGIPADYFSEKVQHAQQAQKVLFFLRQLLKTIPCCAKIKFQKYDWYFSNTLYDKWIIRVQNNSIAMFELVHVDEVRQLIQKPACIYYSVGQIFFLRSAKWWINGSFSGIILVLWECTVWAGYHNRFEVYLLLYLALGRIKIFLYGDLLFRDSLAADFPAIFWS